MRATKPDPRATGPAINRDALVGVTQSRVAQWLVPDDVLLDVDVRDVDQVIVTAPRARAAGSHLYNIYTPPARVLTPALSERRYLEGIGTAGPASHGEVPCSMPSSSA